MRKLMLAIALSAGLAAGGCSTTSGSGGISITSVQQAVQAACGFLPAAASIAALINAGAGATITALVSAICGAVTHPSARLGARSTVRAAVLVNGQRVVIAGHFVQ